MTRASTHHPALTDFSDPLWYEKSTARDTIWIWNKKNILTEVKLGSRKAVCPICLKGVMTKKHTSYKVWLRDKKPAELKSVELYRCSHCSYTLFTPAQIEKARQKLPKPSLPRRRQAPAPSSPPG